MCGVFGALLQSGINETRVRRAVDSLEHRGPDESGIWISPDRRVALGHRRLNVLRPDDGRQPVASEDGTVRAVVNGELYGFETLRQQLISRGHRFSTASDSEVIVHLYEDCGLDFVSKLRGEFALVLWDEKRQQLIAVRDRFGVKPLVYHTTPAGILIASKAKALFAAGVDRRWDAESFFDAASMQYVLPDRTLFQNIRQLPPGSMLIASHENARVERYWDIPATDVSACRSGTAQQSSPESFDQATCENLIQRCRDHVVDAVLCRTRADAPVCYQLSGGLDSSAVLGIAASTSRQPVDAYSITFDSQDYDEQAIAREAASHANARIHLLRVSPLDILHSLSDAVKMSEGLCINGHLSAKYLLSKPMRDDGFKVALTGEGADEAFAGYGHLRIDHWRTTGRETQIDSLAATNRSSLGMMLPHGHALDLSSVQRRLGYVPAWMEAKATFGHRVRSLLNGDFAAQFMKRDPYGELVDAVFAGARLPDSRVDCSTRLWARSALAGYILSTLGDGTEMAHSIEGRVPFLDHHLWEFLSEVPIDLRIHGAIEKYILREAVRSFVPETVYRREKHPFDAPPVSLCGNMECHEFIRDTLASRAFLAQPFFDVQRTLPRYELLATSDETTRLAWDPVFMTVLSTVAVQEQLLDEDSTSD